MLVLRLIENYGFSFVRHLGPRCVTGVMFCVDVARVGWGSISPFLAFGLHVKVAFKRDELRNENFWVISLIFSTFFVVVERHPGRLVDPRTKPNGNYP